jgi:hypothetical protein
LRISNGLKMPFSAHFRIAFATKSRTAQQGRNDYPAIIPRDWTLLPRKGSKKYHSESRTGAALGARAREIIEEFRSGSIALAAVRLCRLTLRRYAAGHADGAAGLVGAALTSVTALSISEQRLA